LPEHPSELPAFSAVSGGKAEKVYALIDICGGALVNLQASEGTGNRWIGNSAQKETAEKVCKNIGSLQQNIRT
jgi:hypothetical protein